MRGKGGTLRIVGGSERGRRIAAPPGLGTRPTSDRVRQAVFDILGQSFDGGRALDLYAGSGALGLEALSRGCEKAVLVERDHATAVLCAANAASLGLGARAEVLELDALAAVKRLAVRGDRFLLIFADPPYEVGPAAALEAVAAAGILLPGGVLVLEHDRHAPPPERAGAIVCKDSRTFGETGVSFCALET